VIVAGVDLEAGQSAAIGDDAGEQVLARALVVEQQVVERAAVRIAVTRACRDFCMESRGCNTIQFRPNYCVFSLATYNTTFIFISSEQTATTN